FGLARAALFVERFRFEREGAFRALDRSLLQVVEARAARGAYTLCSEISLDQLVASHPEGFSKAGSCDTRAPSLSKRFWTSKNVLVISTKAALGAPFARTEGRCACAWR